MIQSMTGYGAAQVVSDGVCYVVEIRSLNNRYLKLVTRLPEHLQFLVHRVERLIRSRLGRGSVAFSLRVRRDTADNPQVLNLGVLQAYVDSMARVSVPEGTAVSIDLAVAAGLPGVCEATQMDEASRAGQEKVVEGLTSDAIDALVEMRCREGAALAVELGLMCESIRELAVAVNARAPVVVTEYHDRLKSRVQTLMQAGGFELAADGLAREVAIYAERCDITEEISRLTSHLDQFVKGCTRDDQVGRTLDFLTQELLREANTIASKSNDAAIAHYVVEVKGLIDRLREQVQNVE